MLVCDLNDEAGEKVAAHSEAFSFQHVDVSKKQDWDAAIQRAVELWGKVDILVNNAGTTYKNKVGQSQCSRDCSLTSLIAVHKRCD